MRCWVVTIVLIVLVGSFHLELRVAQAGQLPMDVHSVSRNRLPPVDREALDIARREIYDASVRIDGSGYGSMVPAPIFGFLGRSGDG